MKLDHSRRLLVEKECVVFDSLKAKPEIMAHSVIQETAITCELRLEEINLNLPAFLSR